MILDDAVPVRPPPRPGFNIRAAMIVPGHRAVDPDRLHRRRRPHVESCPADKDLDRLFLRPRYPSARRASRIRSQGHHGLGSAAGQHPQRHLRPARGRRAYRLPTTPRRPSSTTRRSLCWLTNRKQPSRTSTSWTCRSRAGRSSAPGQPTTIPTRSRSWARRPVPMASTGRWVRSSLPRHSVPARPPVARRRSTSS